MAYAPNYLTVNQPFYSLEPLTDYLANLETVTNQPTEGAIAALESADKVLTDRAVLFPDSRYVHDEGYRIYGYRSCPISGAAAAHARLALHTPGSPEYVAIHHQSFVIPDVNLTWEKDVPQIEFGSEPAPVRLDSGSLETRQRAARSALITLGGHLAVSGAFIEREIEPAYEAVKSSLESIGSKRNEADFALFGLKRIGRNLLNQYWWVQHRGARQNPIGKQEAFDNIHQAWKVVGRPFGKFSRVVSALATKPDF